MSNNNTVQPSIAAILQSTTTAAIPPTTAWPGLSGVVPGPIGPVTAGTIYTGSAAAGNLSSYSFAPAGANIANVGLDLRNGADIRIDGLSLKDFMQQVSLRLNMMVPNPQLEREWDELRTLGEAYRACEKECMDKAKVWDILKREGV